MLTLNQFLFQHGIHIIITPKDGSNYMCVTLRDERDMLVTTNDWEASYGKFENLLNRLIDELSGEELWYGDGHVIQVPELRKI